MHDYKTVNLNQGNKCFWEMVSFYGFLFLQPITYYENVCLPAWLSSRTAQLVIIQTELNGEYHAGLIVVESCLSLTH